MTIALLEGAPPGERFGLSGLPKSTARYFLAVGAGEIGEFTEALAAGEAGLQIALDAGHSHSEVWARYGLGWAHLRHADFAAAVRVLEPGLTLCRALDIRVAVPYIAASLGAAYVGNGRAADGLSLLNEAVTALTAMRMQDVRPWVTTFLGEAYLALGRLAEAREQADQVVELARAHQQRGWEGWALRLLGDVHAHALVATDAPDAGQAGGERGTVDRIAGEPGSAEQAADAYRQALALATELGTRPLIAHCHFGLAKLAARTGRREAPNEHLAVAIALYREMGMRFWLEQAQSALAPAVPVRSR